MLTQIGLKNFKSWRDSGNVKLKPITGFFGPNSSGKTSLLQALLLMKQTATSSDYGVALHFGNEKTLVDLGDFESVIHRHDTGQTLKFSLQWNAKQQVRMPDELDNGIVAIGDEIGFEFELKEKDSDRDLGRALVLEAMSYQMNGRQLGIRRLGIGGGYRMFGHGIRNSFSGYGRPFHHPRPSKFYEFPYSVQALSGYGNFPLDLQQGLELLLRELYYLGPLRVYPNRFYARSGAQPLDMGPAGESVVDAILSSRPPGGRLGRSLDSRYPTIVDEHISEWLRKLGLAHEFRVDALAEGRRIFEIKLRKTPNSAEVLLADMGFGVSQILPVLVLCFYAPGGSTVILEQPDIHLHPSAQARLADVFIDALKKNEVQIVFESHSEHLLRRLQRRIAEGEISQDDVGLFFCSMDDCGYSNIRCLEVDQFGNISNWPRDFFGDQFGEIAAMSEAALRRQVGAE